MPRICNPTPAASIPSLNDSILLEKYLTSYQFCKFHSFKSYIENVNMPKLVGKTKQSHY